MTPEIFTGLTEVAQGKVKRRMYKFQEQAIINRLELILDTVCDVLCVEKAAVKRKARNQVLVNARKLYAYIATKHTVFSYEKIGSLVNKDHASVWHYKNELQKELNLYYQDTTRNYNLVQKRLFG